MKTFVALFGLFVLGLSGLAQALSPEEVADKIQAFYDKTQDFQAAFRQVYRSAALQKDKISTGFVYIKKPGMMRWDYKQPTEKHFVADGKALYIYDPELEQVMVDRSFTGSDLSTAVTFLWGRGRLRDEFGISFSEQKDLGSEKHYVLELKPKKDARFRRLSFVVEKDTFRVSETLVEDPGGNLNRLSFSKMKTNAGLKQEAFRFEIPKGIEVVEMKKP